MSSNVSRRTFIKKTSLGAAGAFIGLETLAAGTAPALQLPGTPALLGGMPLMTKDKWVKWPVWIPETDEPLVLEALRGGVWSRAGLVTRFEEEYARLLGAKRCLSTVNGTNALIVALNQLGVGAGDEVIVPPYTFVATIQAVLVNGAIPVFADIDPHTYQIDPVKIEAKITPRTRLILPVHILGMPADMNRIMAIARKHNLLVLEDACQAHLAEIGGKKAGTIGHAGCFSFQTSKNLAIGEGGAIVSDDNDLMDRCFSCHNLGFPYGVAPGAVASGSVRIGGKSRMAEYQAAIGLVQLKRLEVQTRTRNENAAYLRKRLAAIPGIVPHRLYDNVTQAAYLLFAFRYRQDQFKGLSRDTFIKALGAEGVPVSSGYTPLNTQPFIRDALESKNFRSMYAGNPVAYKTYIAQNQCPQNEALCKEAVWITQNMLLGSTADMELIAGAIERIYKNADRIKKA